MLFTDDGREHAQPIVRRHRLIERFLTDVLGVPWDEVHEEAERLEHAMSPVLEERMLAAIGDAKTCPHGHPIEGAREQGALLADVEPGASVRVLRFENEAEDLLHYLKDVGLHPGLEGTLDSSDDDEVVVSSADGRHTVSRSVAETVSVRADPAPPPGPAARAAGPLQRPLRTSRGTQQQPRFAFTGASGTIAATWRPVAPVAETRSPAPGSVRIAARSWAGTARVAAPS